MGDESTRAAEIAHRQHFAEHAPPWDETPEPIASLPHAEALCIEMVVDDWIRRRERAIEPLRGILERLERGEVDPDGELGQELARIAEDPQPLLDSVRETLRDKGSLGYEVAMTRCVCALQRGEQEDALGWLQRITGNNWRLEFAQTGKKLGWAERLHRDPDDENAEVVSVLWELVAELAEKSVQGKSKTYSNQRAALRDAIRNSISDHLGGKRKPRRDRLTDDGVVPDPIGSHDPEDEEVELRLLLEKAGLTAREEEAMKLQLQDLHGQALADALGVTPGTTRVLIHKAMKKLRQLA